MICNFYLSKFQHLPEGLGTLEWQTRQSNHQGAATGSTPTKAYHLQVISSKVDFIKKIATLCVKTNYLLCATVLYSGHSEQHRRPCSGTEAFWFP